MWEIAAKRPLSVIEAQCKKLSGAARDKFLVEHLPEEAGYRRFPDPFKN